MRSAFVFAAVLLASASCKKSPATIPVARVAVLPDSARVAIGATVQLNAVAEDAKGDPLDMPIAWSTGNAAVATITAEGLVTGVASGSAQITAKAGGISGTVAVTVLAPHTLTVHFSGSGSVTSSPAGISCASEPCSGQFLEDVQVTLTAAGSSTTAFSAWSGDCSGGTESCTLAMRSDHDVTAAFVPGFPISVTIRGNGTVTSTPARMRCAAGICSESFPAGTSVSLAATGAAGWGLTAWSGDCSGASGCSLTADAPHSVTATFERGIFLGAVPSSAAPMTPLKIPATGIDPSAPVLVTFSNVSGYSVTETAKVQVDGSLLVGTPVYGDATTHTPGPGTVTLTVSQGDLASAPVSLDIGDLPTLASLGLPLGKVTHAMLTWQAYQAQARISQLQFFSNVLQGAADVSADIANEQAMLQHFLETRGDVDQIMNNNSVVLSGGPANFDRTSVELSDRLLAAWLAQLPIDTSETQPTIPRRTDTVKSIIDAFDTGWKMGNATTDYQKAGDDARDKTFAATAGAAAVFVLLAAATAPGAAAVVGAGLALAVCINAHNHAEADLADVETKWGEGTATFDDVVKVRDRNAFDEGIGWFQLDTALAGAGLTLVGAEEIEIAGVAIGPAVTAAGTLSDGYQRYVDENLNQLPGAIADAVSSKMASLNEGGIRVSGTLNAQGSAFAYGFRPVMNVSCPGLSQPVQMIADDAGGFSLWVPNGNAAVALNGCTLSAIDPITGTTIGSQPLDLSQAADGATVTPPPVTATCNDGDATSGDGDDPDCD